MSSVCVQTQPGVRSSFHRGSLSRGTNPCFSAHLLPWQSSCQQVSSVQTVISQYPVQLQNISGQSSPSSVIGSFETRGVLGALGGAVPNGSTRLVGLP